MSEAHPVDELLAAARRLLGSGAGPTEWAVPNPSAAVAVPADWNGEAAGGAATTGQHLGELRGQLHQSRRAAATLVAEAGTISRQAHSALDEIETAWAQDKAALRPLAGSTFGQGALLQAGLGRVSEAHDVVANAAARFSETAQRLPAVPQPGPGTEPAGRQVVLSPPAGYIIWCTPSTMATGFICEFLQSDGSIIWRHSPIDITGGMP